VPLTECAPGSAAGLAFNLPLGAWALCTGTTEAVSCTCFAVLLLGPGATAEICAGGVVAVAAGGGVVAVAAGVAEVLELPDWTASAAATFTPRTFELGGAPRGTASPADTNFAAGSVFSKCVCDSFPAGVGAKVVAPA